MLWTARLYRRCLGVRLRAAMEEPGDFWLMVASALTTQVVGIVFLWAIFRAIPQINGWRFWDIVLIYSLVVVTEGLSVLVAQGAWQLAMTVNLGELDAVLVRPYPAVLQVLASAIGINGLGNLLLGCLLLGNAIARVDVHWSPGLILLAVGLLAGATLTKIGLNLATNCAAFWLKSPFSAFAFSMHTLGELARFPITIYGVGVRIVLSVFLPYAFMSFFPATTVLHRGAPVWAGLLTPVVGIYSVAVGTWLFRRGLSRYESSGH